MPRPAPRVAPATRATRPVSGLWTDRFFAMFVLSADKLNGYLVLCQDGIFALNFLVRAASVVNHLISRFVPVRKTSIHAGGRTEKINLVTAPIGTAAIVVGKSVVASKFTGAEEHSGAVPHFRVRRERGDRASRFRRSSPAVRTATACL